MPEHRHPRPLGHDLPEQLQAFRADFWMHEGNPRDIPTWAREAGHKPIAHGIGRKRHHNGDRRRSLHGSASRQGDVGHDEIHLESDQFCRQAGQLIGLLLGISPLDDNVLAFDVAELAQSLPECLRRIGVGRIESQQDPNTPDLPGLRLPFGDKWYGEECRGGDENERRWSEVHVFSL